ncbi:hypothetical protein PAXRUDRAFT_146637 [Paxillus rubicundulus Ve08.2h10]|uniref:Uncharacterized protein n=1 Tax=Paxillus rubicundulus Ve08.2h10 TaxID=930991 RepID=A0A0D0DUI5_9AGAM|nr:hypothetical protein PAXRUDRAFT_146637 [Paxillus rubicundulus Ve08.2h10]
MDTPFRRVRPPSPTKVLSHIPDNSWQSLIVTSIVKHYIQSVQAAWHHLEFPMHLEYPSVYHLPVHLENEPNVTFQGGDVAQQMLEAAAQKDTRFMGWFKANADATCIAAGAHAHACLHQDFQKLSVWKLNIHGCTNGHHTRFIKPLDTCTLSLQLLKSNFILVFSHCCQK